MTANVFTPVHASKDRKGRRDTINLGHRLTTSVLIDISLTFAGLDCVSSPLTWALDALSSSLRRRGAAHTERSRFPEIPSAFLEFLLRGGTNFLLLIALPDRRERKCDSSPTHGSEACHMIEKLGIELLGVGFPFLFQIRLHSKALELI